jgi:hypothetical protein
VKHEADLIGNGRTARCAIGRELRLVELDQVLGLSARAIETVVNPFRRAVLDVGDDEADIETERRRLDAGDCAPRTVPRFCYLSRLTGLPDTARSVRTASAVSSTFLDSGFEPGSPKM